MRSGNVNDTERPEATRIPARGESFVPAELLGELVVADTDSSFVYIGVLEQAGPDFLLLGDADVHDTTDSKQTKETYVHEARRIGVRPNRRRTYLRTARVLSLARLADIVKF